jgi:hypothetical protein
MISALLLPLLLSGSSESPAATKDDPPIQLWISSDRRFLPGERAKVQVRTEQDGYLLVFHVDPEGYLRVLFPLDPDKDNFVRGDKKYEVRGRGDREAFEADGKGRGTVYAAVSRDPFRFDGFVLGDHWDYRALAPSRLSSNPEPELNELVRRMAQGSFDYDLLNYDVVDRAYASDYSPRYYSDPYDPWCYSFSCGRAYYGSGLGISIFFGRPYRRYYYDPYFYAYDPYYNPFFYDPYYYAPAYYPRYVYPRRFYYYPYHGSGYDRYRYYGRTHTPYRFRGTDGFTAGYRDRRYDLRRSINTVYNPPISPVREPSVATPARRVIEPPAAELPRGTAQRRLVDDAKRVQGRPVEARRARPEERTEERSAGEPRLIRREAEARPAREDGGRNEGARETRGRNEGAREAPRPAQRAPAAEPRPRREPERARPAPSQDRGGGRVEGRSSGGGGGREAGGSQPSRPSNEGGRRRP